MIYIELDGLTPINSARHRHWSKEYRERTDWKQRVHWAVSRSLGKVKPPTPYPLEKARVRITRLSVAAKSPDRDNLVHGAKWLLDGLVMAGVLLDDSPDVIVELQCDWERVKHRQDQAMVIEIEKVTEST